MYFQSKLKIHFTRISLSVTDRSIAGSNCLLVRIHSTTAWQIAPYSTSLTASRSMDLREMCPIDWLPNRVTRCPGLPGTVPEWNRMSRVPLRSIPGQWNIPEWIFHGLNSPILHLYFSKIREYKHTYNKIKYDYAVKSQLNSSKQNFWRKWTSICMDCKSFPKFAKAKELLFYKCCWL